MPDSAAMREDDLMQKARKDPNYCSMLNSPLTSSGYVKETNFLLSQRGKQAVAYTDIKPCHCQLEETTSNASRYSAENMSKHRQVLLLYSLNRYLLKLHRSKQNYCNDTFPVQCLHGQI